MLDAEIPVNPIVVLCSELWKVERWTMDNVDGLVRVRPLVKVGNSYSKYKGPRKMEDSVIDSKQKKDNGYL